MLKSPLEGLVSLVTGAASGLGRGTAKYLAEHKGCVVMVDLPGSAGKEVANSIEGNVVYVPCDVTKEADVKESLSVCQEKFGRLDLTVNCAGLARAFKIANPLRHNVMAIAEFLACYESNVYGSFNVARLAAQAMARNTPQAPDGGRGVIINVGSLSAEDGCVGQTAFAAAKGAVAAMTLPMSRDLSPLGIRVVTISPGLFDTPLTSPMCLTPKVREEYYLAQTQFPTRFGDPTEFARMVEEVVKNPMINGEVVRLTGALRFDCYINYPTEEGLEEYKKGMQEESPWKKN